MTTIESSAQLQQQARVKRQLDRYKAIAATIPKGTSLPLRLRYEGMIHGAMAVCSRKQLARVAWPWLRQPAPAPAT